jgi:hypothetical protein
MLAREDGLLKQVLSAFDPDLMVIDLDYVDERPEVRLSEGHGASAEILTYGPAILLVAPVRLGNLAAIRLGVNLIKPGGPEGNYWLKFPKFDVKNRQALQFAFNDKLTKLIDKYVFDFRPVLMKGKNEDWLFPGRSTDHKEKIGFSTTSGHPHCNKRSLIRSPRRRRRGRPQHRNNQLPHRRKIATRHVSSTPHSKKKGGEISIQRRVAIFLLAHCSEAIVSSYGLGGGPCSDHCAGSSLRQRWRCQLPQLRSSKSIRIL